MREWRRGDGRGCEDWRREIPNGGRYGTDHRDVFQREREESVRGVEVVGDARAGRGKREIYWEEMETAQDAGVGGVGGPEWAVFGDGERRSDDSGLGHRERVRDALVQRSYGYGDCGAISRDERGFEAVFWFGLRRGWILGFAREQSGRADGERCARECGDRDWDFDVREEDFERGERRCRSRFWFEREGDIDDERWRGGGSRESVTEEERVVRQVRRRSRGRREGEVCDGRERRQGKAMEGRRREGVFGIENVNRWGGE